jgi:RNA polymerase sigma-70 factor (ECF subfamily)
MFGWSAASRPFATLSPADFERVIARAYDTSFETVYAMAYSASGNSTDAEDLTAETYERAVRRAREFRGDEERLARWIYGIARNVIREYRRDPGRRHLRLDDEDGMSAAPGPADLTQSGMETSRLLATLTPAQREVVTLRLAGLTVAEVARAVGKAEGTVKALHFAAMKRLRKVAER